VTVLLSVLTAALAATALGWPLMVSATSTTLSGLLAAAALPLVPNVAWAPLHLWTRAGAAGLYRPSWRLTSVRTMSRTDYA
jgi:hypothetical protein